MQKKLFIQLLFMLPVLLWGQKPLPEPGPVTVADLKLSSCSIDPDAPAMVLFDIQEVEMTGGYFNSRTETVHRVRIKLFSEKGYQHASVRIPYLNKRGFGKIKKLQGVVYNLDANGKISTDKLYRDDFYDEKAMEYVGIMNFTFPNLRPGCIIEYSYTIIETNFEFLRPWFIQDKIPVVFTSRAFTTPVSTRIVARPYGTDSIDQQYYLLKYDQFRKTTYYKENIPAFKEEPYMSSVSDYLIRASFSSLASGGMFETKNKISPDRAWSILGNSLLNSHFFEKVVSPPIAGTEKIIDSAKKKESLEERICYVFDEVKKHFPNKADQTMETDTLKAAWDSREATTAEINYILLNLLDRSGIRCYPLLVSTRNHGKVKKDFPNLGQMNGVNVLAFDSTHHFVLDASIKSQSYHTPPLSILNRDALLLTPDSSQWVTIADERPLLKQTIDVYADVTVDGKLEGSATIQYFDYAKSYKLDTTLQNENTGDDKFLDKRPAGLKIISSKLDDANNPADPLTETIDFTYEPQNSGQFYFIDPQILTARNKNPFHAEKRTTDVDLGCNQLYILTMQIHFPPAYQPDHLPANMMIRAPDSSFFYKAAYSADKEAVYLSQLFEIKRAVFSQEEYPGIQDFYKRMFALMAEEIILKKKE